MADKQYYIKLSFEFGVDEGGTLTPKNTANAEWTSMPYDAAVILQNSAIIPPLNDMIAKAGELGFQMTGTAPPKK